MSTIACPTCGASGNENCSTVRGNDHRKRMLLEIAEVSPVQQDEEKDHE